MTQKQVHHWMTPDPITAAPATTLTAAYDLMREAGVRHLPIVADGNLVGLISKHDVRRAELAALTTPTEGRQESALATVAQMLPDEPLICLAMNAHVSEAARLMLENELTALPIVTTNQRLVGIITESDLFRVLANQATI